MLLFSFTLRHLRRHWRLNLIVLMGLTLATALLAGLPAYADAIAARSLRHTLDTALPMTRNIQVIAPLGGLTVRTYGSMQEALGEVVKTRVEIRQTRWLAGEVPLTEQVDGGGKIIESFDVWSYDRLFSSVRIVDGELPTAPDPREATNPFKPPPIEVAIGLDTATKTGFKVGDRLVAQNDRYRLDIVGVVEPLDPQDEMWGGDLDAFDILIDAANPNVDFLTVSLLVPPKTMQDYVPGHQNYWRVVVDQTKITADNAEIVVANLVSIQTQLGAHRIQASTGLIKILDNYVTQLSKVRMSLFLLTAQAFIFVLYTLAMLTSFLLDRSQAELAVLSGRGATALQITRIFATQALILALPAALLLGPYIAHGATTLWAGYANAPAPTSIADESRLLALIAAGFGWLAIVLPVYPAARRNVLEWQRTRARPERLARWQKLYLDLFLLALGGLAYWQLNQAGSFVMLRAGDSGITDPILLLGPSLLLVAVALVFLRVFPHLLRLVAWAFKRTRGLMLPIGLTRLARDPVKPSRVVLLISLAAGLAFFASTFGTSLYHNQAEMSHYVAGADMRVSLTEIPIETLAQLPGVQTAAPVFRGVVQTEEGRGIQLLAVDPETFDQVARYFSAISNLSISSITRILEPKTADDPLPVIMSFSAIPTRKTVGDEVLLSLAGSRPSFKVLGSISNFPTLSGSFAIVSLPDLASKVDLTTLGARRAGNLEAWLTIDPAQYETLIGHPEVRGRILSDAQEQLRVLQNDVTAQGTSGAFDLNTLTLALLSVAGFLLVHFFAAQQRRVEFSILRAMGLSTRQLLTLLSTEGALVIGMGLLAGTAIGYGLANVMVPYLSRAISDSLAGVSIPEALVSWTAVAQLYLILITFYAVAILLLQLALMRGGIHRELRIGDE